MNQFTVLNTLFIQRESDGYIDATEITRSHNKQFSNWFRLKKAKECLI